MRLLIVEDDPSLLSYLKTALQEECFAVDAATDGEQGSFMARTNDYDIIILDNNLPKKNGPQICREIRKEGKCMPIIGLSVQNEIPKKVELLDDGADDYITKPFSLQELVARIHTLLRRPSERLGETMRVDDLILDSRRHLVLRGGQEINLTKKEFMLLEFLMKQDGVVATRGAIMEHVWDINGDLFSNTIEAHVLSLRKKVDAGNKRPLIHTVPGRGYKITSKVTYHTSVSSKKTMVVA